MIRSFGNAVAADIYNGKDTKAARTIDRRLWKNIARKIDQINAAHDLRDLNTPGNRLHPLKGEMKGTHTIWVNEQFRITFEFKEGSAFNVWCGDYHD